MSVQRVRACRPTLEVASIAEEQVARRAIAFAVESVVWVYENEGLTSVSVDALRSMAAGFKSGEFDALPKV